ncbi:hypothetical protein AB0M36_08910 [Actinoplanes sp. NPDC051346]|uniref:hypothetical protein n=1 Tax=Actinoplanes sp. NPDC051346 TaxID=3155048 RepID=UPI00344A2E9C
MGFKFWLRGPADDPQVEIIGPDGWYWRSGHFRQRRERSDLPAEDESGRDDLSSTQVQDGQT